MPANVRLESAKNHTFSLINDLITFSHHMMFFLVSKSNKVRSTSQNFTDSSRVNRHGHPLLTAEVNVGLTVYPHYR